MTGSSRSAPPIGLLVGISLMGPFAIHMIVPSLPYLQREFGTDYATAQLLVSLFMVAFGGAQILVGPLADALGRRRVLIGGLTLFSLISALCALATSIEMLVALRVLQGACGCVGIVLGRAIVRDISADDQTARVLGYLAMGMSVGPMIAPAAGGLLFETFGWRAPFWSLAIFAATVACLAFLLVPETHARAPGRFRFSTLLADFRSLLGHRSFVLCGAAICFNTSAFYAFVAGGPFVAAEVLNMTPSSYGAWFAIVALGYAIGNFTAGRLGRRIAGRSIIVAGSVIVLVAIAVMGGMFWTGRVSPPVMFLCMGIITFGSGLVMPQALAGALGADPSKAGSAAGFIGFTQFAVSAAFSTIAGKVIELNASALPLVAVMFVAGAATLAAALLLRRT